MYKKIIGIAFITLAAWGTNWNFNCNNDIGLTDIVLDNIEALASPEGDAPGYFGREDKIIIDKYGQVGFQTVCYGSGNYIC